MLKVHDQGSIKSIIGRAELTEGPDGLAGRITLAPLNVNADTYEIERLVREGYLRGVSVGFTFGERKDEVRDGQQVAVFRNNELNEISLVPVPADAGALARSARGLGFVDKVPTAEELEEQQRADVSDAAKKLASARKTKLDATDDHHHFDQGKGLGKVQRTQIGGIRVAARLTRTGVLRYVLPDGKISHQLRLPEEVFDADSLATLHAAPVTDLAHHRAFVSPHTYREAALGHAENVRVDGKYVVADLLVNDARTADAVESGELADISCGYSCKHDYTPGVFEGQAYDLIQRSIRYNHVAVLPPGKGRAGPDVSILFDSTDAPVCVEQAQESIMEKTFIKLDGKDYEFGSASHIEKLEDLHKAQLSSATGELQKKYDTLDGEHAALKKTFDAKKAADEVAAKEDGEKTKRAIRSRVRLIMKALRLFGDDEEADDDEKKSDSKFDALDELNDREIMLKVIGSHADYKNEKFDAKSDEYVTAIFDSVSRSFKRADGVDSVVEGHRRAVKLDAIDLNNPVEKAKAEKAKRDNERWRKPLLVTKG